MDKIVDYISSYGFSLDFRALPEPVVHQAKRILLDSLACALGGYTSEPSKVARKMADGVCCPQPATIIFSGQKTTPELATFANGIMVRYLDFNDGYTGKMTSHPSDMFAPVLSCADAYHVNGKLTITAAVVAYEVLCRLCDAVAIVAKQFDSSTLGAISSAVGAAKVLGLSRDQMTQCINLAVASNIALRQIRRGELSMWKGCAFPNACRNGVFAARLAAEGMTGPEPIFEGQGGFFNAVSGPFQLEEFGGNGQPFKIMETSVKRFPAGLYSQPAIDAVLRIRPRLKRVEDVTEVNIQTVDDAFDIMAGDAQKWHPRTRESADHSMPYLVSVALTHGGLELRHFSDRFLSEGKLLELAQKVKVRASEECNRALPETYPSIVEVATKDGNRLVEKVVYHRGHFKNPMSDAEIEQKFISLAEGLLSPPQIRQTLDMVWKLDEVDDVGSLMNLLMI